MLLQDYAARALAAGVFCYALAHYIPRAKHKVALVWVILCSLLFGLVFIGATINILEWLDVNRSDFWIKAADGYDWKEFWRTASSTIGLYIGFYYVRLKYKSRLETKL